MKIWRYIAIATAILTALLVFCSCKGGEEVLTEATYYTVTFDSTGANDVEPMRVIDGGTVSAPIEPVREGYIFDGWVDNAGDDWNFGSDTVKSDITLFARWIEASTVFDYLAIEGAEGEAKISSLKQEFSSVIRIPTSIKGLKVVGIGDGVFDEVSVDTVEKIIVPDTVRSVGNNAFRGCFGIEIVIEGELTEIGEAAFLDCDGISAVRFGEGLKEISVQAFAGCIGLKNVHFPSTLERISENAFEDCASLVYAIMHSPTKLSNSAFIGCEALVTVYYYGTEADFDAIFAQESDQHGNGTVSDAKLYIYSAEKPEEDGTFWYMDEKGKIKLWK